MSTADAKTPNRRLIEVMAEAGISSSSLAQQVTQRAAANGVTVSYTHRSVANWRRGMLPQPAVRRLVADILGDRIGRFVALAELGFPTGHDQQTGLHFPRDPAKAVAVATAFFDTMHQPDLADSPLSVAAYDIPLRRWLTADADTARVPSFNGPHVGRSDVDDLVAAAEELRRVDSRYGGGNWRAAWLHTCLTDRLTPLLRGHYSEATGRQLFSTAAELTRLGGWMAFDAGRHGLAQRYFIQALRLARAAGDVGLGCYILACMGLQTSLRGYHDLALDILDAATDRSHGRTAPRVTAFCSLTHARAHARARDRRRALIAFSTAERLLDQHQDPADGPNWMTFLGRSRLAADAVEIHRDLGLNNHARHWHLDAPPDTGAYRRSHGLRQLVLATTYLTGNVDLDHALDHGSTALDVLDAVTSARAIDYLNDLANRLSPWMSHPPVADFITAVRAGVTRRSGQRSAQGARCGAEPDLVDDE